jgi:hypothetical protein
VPELPIPRPDPEPSVAEALRTAVAARVATLAPALPPEWREALVEARTRFLARWPSMPS